MSKDTEADPNEGLADDAAEATDLGDESERRKQQLEYYGGEDDDLDYESFEDVDRGDVLEEEEDDDEEKEEEQATEDEDESAAEEDDSDEDDDSEDDDASDDESGDDGDEEDAEESEDSDADDDDVESEDTPKSDQRIPIGRFNEVNERMKAAERRLAELENQEDAAEQVQKESYDFDKAESEYQELLLDGKVPEATSKRKEIRSAEHELWKQETKQETIQDVNHAEMERELNELTGQAAKMYPTFDDASADFDPVATNKVLTFMRGYVGEMEPDDAFVAALSDVIDIYGLDTKYGYTEDEATEKPAEKPAAKKKGSKKQTKKKIELAEKQVKTPAGQGRASTDSGVVAPDIDKMSDAELEALPEATLARLRGDFVD